MRTQTTNTLRYTPQSQVPRHQSLALPAGVAGAAVMQVSDAKSNTVMGVYGMYR